MKTTIQYSKDWKDKIFIDTKAINELSETLPVEFTEKRDYSITPATLKKVTFQKDLAEPIFTEEYTFKENSVIRFGINIHNKEFRKILDNELNIHNQNLLEEILEQSEKITNISGQTNYEKFSKHIQLTKCENYVLKEAVDYMNTNSKKAVLVDIFPREFSQNKKTQEPAGRIDLEKLEIHTVLLYKTEGNKVLTIDPNNPMFSTHLNKYVGCKIETLCSTALEHKIYSRPEGSNTGFAPDKFRDCIDIAAKLGLLLNQDKKSYGTINEIMKSDTVKLITNNPLLHEMDFTINDSIRLKQSSDIKLLAECNNKMHTEDRILKAEKEKAALAYKTQLEEIKMQYAIALNAITESRDIFVGDQNNQYETYLTGDSNEL